MEQRLKVCRACGRCAEKMDMCAICKDRFQTKWYGLNLARKYLKIEIVVCCKYSPAQKH